MKKCPKLDKNIEKYTLRCLLGSIFSILVFFFLCQHIAVISSSIYMHTYTLQIGDWICLFPCMDQLNMIKKIQPSSSAWLCISITQSRGPFRSFMVWMFGMLNLILLLKYRINKTTWIPRIKVLNRWSKRKLSLHWKAGCGISVCMQLVRNAISESEILRILAHRIQSFSSKKRSNASLLLITFTYYLSAELDLVTDSKLLREIMGIKWHRKHWLALISVH